MRKFGMALLMLLMMSGAVCLAEAPVIESIVDLEVVALDGSTPTPAPIQTAAPTSAPAASAEPAPTVTPALIGASEALASLEPIVTVQPVPVNAQGTLMTVGRAATMAVGGIFANNGSTVLGSGVPCETVTSVRFEASLIGAPADAWDVSEEGNGSVLAWLNDGALTIASQGGVLANADCSNLFAGYASVTDIDFNGSFDTSRTTNMAHMFEGCWGLTSLDLTGLDTSNVTDMSYMFSSCVALTALDISGFRTAQTQSMEGMFFMAMNLEALDLSGLDTSAVTSTRSMFESCAALQVLDLTNFNLAADQDMRWMFSGCAALEKVEFGPGFSVAKQSADMFADCPAEMTIAGEAMDLENWSDLERYTQLKLWSRGEDVRWLQNRLKSLGYGAGSADGVFGPNTESALKEWQRDNGYEATGKLTIEQAKKLS